MAKLSFSSFESGSSSNLYFAVRSFSTQWAIVLALKAISKDECMIGLVNVRLTPPNGDPPHSRLLLSLYFSSKTLSASSTVFRYLREMSEQLPLEKGHYTIIHERKNFHFLGHLNVPRNLFG